MPPLPARFAGIIPAFAPLFVHRLWRPAQILLIGAILTPGRRTVTSVMRIMAGRTSGASSTFTVCSAAPLGAPTLTAASCSGSSSRPSRRMVPWCSVATIRSSGAGAGASRHEALPRSRTPVGQPLRQGERAALDELDSARPIPWAGRVGALPFLTVLVPFERAYRERGRRHKSLLAVGRQFALQARRRLRDVTSWWWATAASLPCCSSTSCAAPASRRSPACGPTQRSTIQPRRGHPARSDAHGPKARSCRRSPHPSRPGKRADTRSSCQAGTGRAST